MKVKLLKKLRKDYVITYTKKEDKETYCLYKGIILVKVSDNLRSILKRSHELIRQSIRDKINLREWEVRNKLIKREINNNKILY